MRRTLLRALTPFILTFSVLIATPIDLTAQAAAHGQRRTVLRRPIPVGALNQSLDFARTELYFGTAKAEGEPPVTDEQFLEFLDREITPRFPDGLTLLKGDGQFQGASGVIIKEDSFVLILLYSLEGFRDSSRKINRIRELYKDEFDQESVLRVDDPFAVRVSF
jgi:Protein of unknown function (DUF3574)